MSKKFKELYDYCQTLTPKVSTNKIEAHVLELCSISSVSTIKSGLDLTKMRGYFVSAKNTDSPLVKQLGTNVIVIGRGMNDCWDRFVRAKELMHLLDSTDDATSSPEEFIGLLTDFEEQVPSPERSKQFTSELNCLWMAIACLCPETARQEFLKDCDRGHIDNYGIALKLKIPEQHVRQLLRPNFLDIIQGIIGR